MQYLDSSDKCRSLRVCTVGVEYETRAPTASTDRACAVATRCPIGMYQTAALTATSDRQCTPCPRGTADTDGDITTPCRACADGKGFQDEEGKTTCKGVSECPPGEEERFPPSRYHDRVCVACAVGTTFKVNAGQQDRCIATTACAAGQWQAPEGGAPTASSDRRCTACPDDHFKPASGSGPCIPHTRCKPGTGYSTAPTATADGVCTPCDRGNTFNDGTFPRCLAVDACTDADEYLKHPATLVSNNICAPITKCAAKEYLFRDATATSDAICDACTACPQSGELTACSAREDAVCKEGCPRCAHDEWEPQACSAACKPCTRCALGQYAASPCDGRHDTVCNMVTTCTAGKEYEAMPPGSDHDRQCLPLTSCPAGTYSHDEGDAMVVRSYDRICLPVATCPAGTVVRAAATPTSNVVCSPCAPGETSFGGTCVRCGPGHGVPANADRDCTAYACGVGTFGADGVVCRPCPPNQFQSAAGQAECEATTPCGAGTEELVAPTTYSDRACTPCVSGRTYGNSRGSCTEVRRCQAGTGEKADGGAPTPTSDRTCEPCKEGKTFSAGPSAGPCMTVGTCPPGTMEASTPTTRVDRGCKPCPQGTFSDTDNAVRCQAWSRCPAKAITIAMPTATTDRLCAKAVVVQLLVTPAVADDKEAAFLAAILAALESRGIDSERVVNVQVGWRASAPGPRHLRVCCMPCHAMPYMLACTSTHWATPSPRGCPLSSCQRWNVFPCSWPCVCTAAIRTHPALL